MDTSHLRTLPHSLRQVLTNLPVFYLLESLGRNPGSWETAWGFAHRVGISYEEAVQTLESLVTQGYLTRTESLTGEPIYRLGTDQGRRQEILELAERVNRNREAFRGYVREILRRQVDQPQA